MGTWFSGGPWDGYYTPNRTGKGPGRVRITTTTSGEPLQLEHIYRVQERGQFGVVYQHDQVRSRPAPEEMRVDGLSDG